MGQNKSPEILYRQGFSWASPGMSQIETKDAGQASVGMNEDPLPARVSRHSPAWHVICFSISMLTKTLYYCPKDENVLLFEDIYDERLDFVYQPLHEIPRVCPKCGSIWFKKDCLVIEELFAAPANAGGPAVVNRRCENP
jgi:hypothetical protein